jgi:hypothetical protein
MYLNNTKSSFLGVSLLVCASSKLLRTKLEVNIIRGERFMDNIQSSSGLRKNVRAFLAILLFAAVLLQALSVHGQTVFAASNWRMGAGAGDPAALGFEPFGMDIDPINGYLFVTDESTFAVKIFDLNGKATGMTLTASSGSFSDPLTVKFDEAGHVYITDKWYIYRFDVSFSNGSYLFNNMIKWDGNNTVPSVGRLSYPQGIAVYGKDLYITDTNANRVLKFDASTFSPTSSPEVWSGDLDPDPAIDAIINNPFGIVADSSGVFISNNVGTNGNIIKRKTDGSTLIKAINRPKGLRLHSDGYLYVAVNGSNDSLVTRLDSNLNEDSVYFPGNASAISPANIGFDHTGALYLSTYAQIAPYDPVYDTIWKQSLGSPDNRLSAVTASGMTLSPSPFSPNTLNYTASVASSVTSTTITPILSDSTASVTVNGTSVASGSASSPIALSKGENTNQIVVTASNGATRIYTINVTRAPYTDSALSRLTVSPGSLNETFDAGKFTYTASVANSVTSIDVTPTVNNNRATLKVKNVAATSGSASTVSALVVGPNTITVTVTAEDGTTSNDYTIIVTRAPSTIGTLASLTISQGSLNEAFASATLAYTADVANNVDSLSVTPTVADSTATVKVNGASSMSGNGYGPIPLDVGTNTITIVVSAQDGVTTSSYSIVVTRAASSAAALSGLAISQGSLNEAFASATLAYTADVANNVDSLSVTPTVSDSTATVKVNGASSMSGNGYGPIPLDVGTNTITIVVTAQDRVTTSSYSIVVTRAASSAAALSGLTINPGTLNETFVPETLAYTANVEHYVSSTNVTPFVGERQATITINSVPVATGASFGPIALNTGSNIVTVTVTAQDGLTQRSYRLDIYRRPTTGPLPEQPSGGNGTTTPPVSLNDITGNWAEAEIRKAVLEGWVTGYPDGSFHPEREVTRAEFVQMLARSQGWKEPEKWNMPDFTDNIDIGQWARPAISMAVQKGIINGYEDGSFRPTRSMTRAEMTTMIIRTLDLPVDTDHSNSFADNSKIPLWSLPYITEAAKLGLVKGMENNRFEPNRAATRAEVVVILTRLLRLK